MINEIDRSNELMNQEIAALKNNFSKIYTGRAHPGLLSDISVECYGTTVPLNQVANVATESSSILAVSAFDNSLIPQVEKAIQMTDMNLNPMLSGTVIRISFPPLTEQRRKYLVEVIRGEAESARTAIRNIRRDANDELSALLKKQEISEDETDIALDRIRKIADEAICKVDEALAAKEKELTEV